MIFPKKERSTSARPWFCWFPVTLIDGRTAWLTVVNRYINRDNDYIIYYPIDGVTR